MVEVKTGLVARERRDARMISIRYGALILVPFRAYRLTAKQGSVGILPAPRCASKRHSGVRLSENLAVPYANSRVAATWQENRRDAYSTLARKRKARELSRLARATVRLESTPRTPTLPRP